MTGPNKGGSSESNGPNERARDAARDEGLNQEQREQLQRDLEREREDLSYWEIRERARQNRDGH